VELGPADPDLRGRRADPRLVSLQRHKGNANPLVLASGFVFIAFTALLALPRPSADGGGPVAFDQVQPIIQARCVSCHAAKPTQEGFLAPPKGILLETPSQIHAMAAAINQQAAASRVMPPGNLTQITDAERRMIARWFKGGAQ
jgi:uncharacterized membrane protein